MLTKEDYEIERTRNISRQVASRMYTMLMSFLHHCLKLTREGSLAMMAAFLRLLMIARPNPDEFLTAF